MSQVIYMVEAEKGWSYEGGTTSVVFTTFDETEAVEFAQDYFDRNKVLTVEAQSYDYLDVRVNSSVVGEPNTEKAIWNSHSGFVKTNTSRRDLNIEFAFDLEAALIALFKERVVLNMAPTTLINPTLGFAAGFTSLETVVSSDICVTTINHAVDNYAYYIRSLKSAALIEEALAKGGLETVDSDAESEDNALAWALYEQFEQPHYLN